MKSKKFLESLMDDSLSLAEDSSSTEDKETEPEKNTNVRKKLEIYLERKRLRKLLSFFH